MTILAPSFTIFGSESFFPNFSTTLSVIPRKKFALSYSCSSDQHSIHISGYLIKMQDQSTTNKEPDDPVTRKKGLALLIYDLKQPKLFPVKIMFIILFSGYGVLLPYMPMHMKSLGMTVEETGIIFGISSVLGVLSPFIIGVIGDKIGNFKVFSSLIHALLAVLAIVFLFIPIGRVSIKHPVNVSLAVGCHSSSTLMLTDLDSNPCDFHQSINDSSVQTGVTNVFLALEECGYVCYHNQTDNNTTQEETLNEVQSEEIQYRQAVFLPDNKWTLDISCWATNISTETNSFCTLNKKIKENESIQNISFELSHLNSSQGSFLVYSLEGMGENRMLNNFQCQSYDKNFRRTVNNSETNQTVLQFCKTQCVFRTNRSVLCSNKESQQVIEPQLTFWLYMFCRLIMEMLFGGSDALFNGATVALVNKLKGDLGFQRMFGLAGIAVASPIAGAIIDHFSIPGESSNFRPTFYLFAGLFTIVSIGMLFIDLDFKPPADDLLKDVKSLLTNVELDALLVMALTSGMVNGGSGSFAFLFVEELGGTRSVMGLAVMGQCILAVPILMASDTIYRKFGHRNVIIFCFAVNFIRLTGYSFLIDPRLCLIFETMEAISSSFSTTTIMSLSAKFGSTNTSATIQGLVAGIYYGLGIGSGSFIASLLIGSFGYRTSFRILGVFALITGCIYLLFKIFFSSNRKCKINGEKSI